MTAFRNFSSFQLLKLSLGAGEGIFLTEVLGFRRRTKAKSKVLSDGFCLRDSEAEQRELKFLHTYCSKCKRLLLSSKSNRQNPHPHSTIDIPFFFRYKHKTSLKDVPTPASSESLPYWFQGNFAAMFALNYWLREFLLSAFANRFVLRCERKQPMLLCHKICPYECAG